MPSYFQFSTVCNPLLRIDKKYRSKHLKNTANGKPADANKIIAGILE